jgi:hypothetical protein
MWFLMALHKAQPEYHYTMSQPYQRHPAHLQFVVLNGILHKVHHEYHYTMFQPYQRHRTHLQFVQKFFVLSNHCNPKEGMSD